MKLGMNLLLWTDDATGERFLPLCERLKKMGYDGVEIPVFSTDVKRYEELGRRLRDMGLAVTAITARAPGENPISPDPAVRAAGIEANKRAAECAAAAGSTLLAGPVYASLGVFSGAGPTPDEWAWGVESARAYTAHAATLGVTIGLEFLNRFEIYLLNCAADAARFAREVGLPNIGVHYDTFHAHIEEKDIAAAIRGCAKQLCHVHVSENDRSTPGKGQVDWDGSFAALKAAGWDGWLTLEAFGLALPSLAAATRIWRRMFDDEEQLAREGAAFLRAAWRRATPGGAAAATPRTAARRPTTKAKAKAKPARIAAAKTTKATKPKAATAKALAAKRR